MKGQVTIYISTWLLDFPGLSTYCIFLKNLSFHGRCVNFLQASIWGLRVVVGGLSFKVWGSGSVVPGLGFVLNFHIVSVYAWLFDHKHVS